VDNGIPQPDASPAAGLALTPVLSASTASTGESNSFSSKPRKSESDLSLRKFIESAILFLVVVITLRALTIEPFGVPTGSMAMTMIGNHKVCTCPRCGFPVVVGSNNSGKPDAAADRAYLSAWCPNCGQGDLHLEHIREAVGDRLLVDKNLFELRKPHRWEVAVFRNPSDLTKPYVKRVVGLPGESIQIQDGDVFIDNQLLRKDLEQARTLRVLVFDNNYQPPQGWGQRWVKGIAASTPADLATAKSAVAASEHLDGTALKWSATGNDGDYQWIAYRHWLLDEGREETIRDWFAYNGAALQQEVRECHDFSVEFEIESGAESGSLALKLTDGGGTVGVEIPIVPPGGQNGVLTLSGTANAPVVESWARLTAGRSHHLEFALVDRRVMLAIDGKEAFLPVDLPVARNRTGVSRPVWLGAKGTSVVIRNFRLYRDVYYTPSGRNGIYEPWRLGPNEYFMLGDNSANSEDSRFWSIPGVPIENFFGRPLLLHQPSRWSTVGSWQLQSLDWDRIRLIR
jgi:signal peptidase I